jgi:DNA-binding MarR family transcriptional regulator
MVDFLPAILGILLAATIAASTEYYRQVRRAQKEYEEAKDVVEDIVLSFNRELKREADRLELIAFKVEGSSAKADASLKEAGSVEMRVAPLENQLKVISQNNVNILSGLNGLESEVKSIENSQETLGAKIANIEEQIQKLTTIPEIKSELVIPIKRDKAMAALTDTEIAVLEMLSSEGSKTAPEIKDRLQLSREHTARLMKKLYEEGYLEREVGKIPFRYSIKKEMERLLKKTESSQPT